MLRTFEKGKSFNPGGRPKKTEEQREFERKGREWLRAYAIDKIISLGNSGRAIDFRWAVDKLTEYCFLAPVRESYLDASIEGGLNPGPNGVREAVAELIRESKGTVSRDSGGSPTGFAT